MLPADDPGTHSRLELKWITDRDHPVADREAVGVAEFGDRQAAGVGEPHHGEVAVGVGLDVGRLEFTTVGESHHDLVGPLDHVIVGDHDPLGRHDHARAHAGAARHPAVGRVELEVFRNPVGKHALKGRALKGVHLPLAWPAVRIGPLGLHHAANHDHARCGDLSRIAKGRGERRGMNKRLGCGERVGSPGSRQAERGERRGSGKRSRQTGEAERAAEAGRTPHENRIHGNLSRAVVWAGPGHWGNSA